MVFLEEIVQQYVRIFTNNILTVWRLNDDRLKKYFRCLPGAKGIGHVRSFTQFKQATGFQP